MEHSNRKFILQFRINHNKVKALIPSLFTSATTEDQTTSTTPNTPSSSYYSINTIPMLVIQRRFSVQLEMNNNTTYNNSATEDEPPTSSAGGAASTQSYVWYKDEGGKDHGIELTISLINKEHEALLGEEVPFLISLHYQHHTDTALNSTNLYTIIPDNSHVIDKFSGRCCKKLRIHDISKNHQRQCFVIKISPDISKSSKYFDIAADESAPIEVRSKRSKRSRDPPADVTASTTIGGALRTAGSSSTNLTSLLSAANVATSPIIGSGSHSLLEKGGHAHAHALANNTAANQHNNSRKRTKLATTTSSSASDISYPVPPPPPPPPLSSLLSYGGTMTSSSSHQSKGFPTSMMDSEGNASSLTLIL